MALCEQRSVEEIPFQSWPYIGVVFCKVVLSCFLCHRDELSQMPIASDK